MMLALGLASERFFALVRPTTVGAEQPASVAMTATAAKRRAKVLEKCPAILTTYAPTLRHLRRPRGGHDCGKCPHLACIKMGACAQRGPSSTKSVIVG